MLAPYSRVLAATGSSPDGDSASQPDAAQVFAAAIAGESAPQEQAAAQPPAKKAPVRVRKSVSPKDEAPF
jgi:hypothetical protein